MFHKRLMQIFMHSPHKLLTGLEFKHFFIALFYFSSVRKHVHKNTMAHWNPIDSKWSQTDYHWSDWIIHWSYILCGSEGALKLDYALTTISHWRTTHHRYFVFALQSQSIAVIILVSSYSFVKLYCDDCNFIHLFFDFFFR